MWDFAWRTLAFAPPAIAGVGFTVWLLVAPSPEARWTERWVGLGRSLSVAVWVVNVVAEALALWAWFGYGQAVVPDRYMDRGGAWAVLGIVAPGAALTSLALGLIRARMDQVPKTS